MTINREQLVELLVQKTGMPEEAVQKQLSELISTIKSAAEQGEQFEIERFGTFSMQNEELHFEPAETLSTEVNNKYAGMEPIELIGAYEDSETAGGQPEDQQSTEAADEDRAQETTWPEEDDIWGWEETESQTADAENNTDEEDTVEEQQNEEITEETEEQTIAQETEGAPADEPAPDGEEHITEQVEEQSLPESEGELASETEPEPVLSEDEAVEADQQQDEEEKPKQQPALSKTGKSSGGLKPRSKQRSTGNSTYTILVAAAMVIIIAVSAWFMFEFGTSTESGNGGEGQSQQGAVSASNQMPGSASRNDTLEQSSEQDGQSDQTSPTDQSQQQTTPPSQTSGDGSEPEPQNQVAKTEEEQTGSSMYGLKGDLNSDANDGYTIVVYSMQNQRKAKELYNNLNQEGYRTMLVPAIVEDTRFWRVAIGQFPTIDEAESTARDLPDPHSNNFFIKRIR